jgi:DNA-binding MarR family transcriptional regulator
MKTNSEIQVEVARSLKSLMIQLRQSMDTALSPLGVTSAQYTMLAALAEQPEVSGAELARKCRVTPQTTHKMLIAIETEGWIQREKQPTNEKSVFVRLTPSGERVLNKARPARFEVVKSMLRGFSSADVQNFSIFINKCQENLDG